MVMPVLFRAVLVPILLLLNFATAPAVRANVAVHFYSSDFGDTYPHAFVVIEGVLKESGRQLSANYGFTAKRVTPSILYAPVTGHVQKLMPGYIAKADRQFSIKVDDAGYARLMARVGKWQARKQPSYDLGSANCVHFVMDMAEAVGLKVNRTSAYFKNPRAFLKEVAALNPPSIR